MSDTPAPSRYNATLVARSDHGPQLATFWVRPDVPFTSIIPGQYVTLGLDGSVPRGGPAVEEARPSQSDRMVQRAYSIASAGHRTDELEFFVAHVPDGSLTPRLWTLSPGDRLLIGRRVTGSFTLDTLQTRTVVMVGTGTGIAPFVAILRDQLAARSNLRIALLHGGMYRSQLAYLPELTAFARQHAHFTYFPSVSRPHLDPGWTGLTGRLTTFFAQGGERLRELAGIELNPSVSDVFLCGNPDMITDIEALLSPAGYERHGRNRPGSLHVEEFWQNRI